MKTKQFLKQVSLWSILGVAILSILLVIPVTNNFINDSKNFLLFFGSALVILLFILKTLREKAIRITVSPITSALLFFGLSAAASTFFTSNYPVESLLGMGGIYLSATIIAILGGSLIPKDSITKFINGLTIASVILIITTVLQMVGFGPAQLINKMLNTNLPTSMIFNIVGSPFIALQIVGFTLVGIITSIITKKNISKIFAVSLPILIIGAGLFAWNLLPGKPTSLVLPPLNGSWSIMLDSIKNPKSALIGAGPSAYTNVYNIFKPLWINNTNQWSAVFSQATNFPLTLLSTVGILGLITWGFLVFKFVKLHKRSLTTSKPIIYMIGISFLLQMLLPVNSIMITIQAVAIAFLIANEKHRLPLLQLQALKFRILNKTISNDKPSKMTHLPLYLSVILGLAGVTTLFYLIGRAYYANIVMAQSSKAINSNDLVGAYELQKKAVALNPYLDTFRRTYSLTNLSIAAALSNKADISDTEKQQVSSLLQQAVREARIATTLDSAESQNWTNLAQVYRNMINVSEDAAQWAVQSYTSAIETNPNDPILRIDLAGIFVAQENYQQAISILSQAVNLKPDLAETHFNLALVLEKLDSPDSYREARISYQRALVLLDTASEEYVFVNQKIEKLEALMKEKGISLEPEKTQAQNGNNPNEIPNANNDDSSITTPSITEQNINNTGVKNSDDNVDLNSPTESENQGSKSLDSDTNSSDEATQDDETSLSDEL